MGHLVSGYRVVLLCHFMVQKSYYKCLPSMFVCEKPGLVRSTSWWSTTQQSMQLVIEMSHSRLYCRDFGDFVDFVCKSTRVQDSSNSALEGHCPAEFSFLPNQKHMSKLI